MRYAAFVSLTPIFPHIFLDFWFILCYNIEYKPQRAIGAIGSAVALQAKGYGFKPHIVHCGLFKSREREDYEAVRYLP